MQQGDEIFIRNAYHSHLSLSQLCHHRTLHHLCLHSLLQLRLSHSSFKPHTSSSFHRSCRKDLLLQRQHPYISHRLINPKLLFFLTTEHLHLTRDTICDYLHFCIDQLSIWIGCWQTCGLHSSFQSIIQPQNKNTRLYHFLDSQHDHTSYRTVFRHLRIQSILLLLVPHTRFPRIEQVPIGRHSAILSRLQSDLVQKRLSDLHELPDLRYSWSLGHVHLLQVSSQSRTSLG